MRADKPLATAEAPDGPERIWILDDKRRVIFWLELSSGRFGAAACLAFKAGQDGRPFSPSWPPRRQIAAYERWASETNCDLVETDEWRRSVPAWATPTGGCHVTQLPEWLEQAEHEAAAEP